MTYRPGRSARKMYRHKARYGTAGMSKRQLRALRREMDIGVNPRRKKRRNPRSRYYTGRKSTRMAWNPRRRRNPVLMNPRARRNPKRDGSMTKGEVRLQKHAEWLRLIADRGRKATQMLKSMHTVPVASHAAIHEHAEDKVSASTIAKALDGQPAALAKVEEVVEHAEAKFLRQQIADLTMLINSTTDEANALGEADEGMAEELMGQVTKMSKQRKTLKDKATGLGIRTNPRPRSSRRSVLVGTRRYARALAELKAVIRRRPRG